MWKLLRLYFSNYFHFDTELEINLFFDLEYLKQKMLKYTCIMKQVVILIFHSLKCEFAIMSRSGKKSHSYYHRLNQVK